MNTSATKLAIRPGWASVFQEEQAKRTKALQPLIEQANRFAHILESAFNNCESRLEMLIYRKANQDKTPAVAKILQRLINFLSFLIIVQSINSHPQNNPKKISSRLHTLGVIPCAPNAFV